MLGECPSCNELVNRVSCGKHNFAAMVEEEGFVGVEVAGELEFVVFSGFVEAFCSLSHPYSDGGVTWRNAKNFSEDEGDQGRWEADADREKQRQGHDFGGIFHSLEVEWLEVFAGG